MDFDSIIKAVTNGQLTLTTDDLTNLVIVAMAKDDHIDCDMLKVLISNLQSVKKTALEDFTESKKEIENANKIELIKRGKAYWDSIPVGTEVSWRTDKKLCSGTKGITKEGTKTAHCILNELPSDSKSKRAKLDRYVKFDRLIVPEDFGGTNDTETN